MLRVTDNGIGIAPDMLPKVFDLFVQVAPIATRSQGGLGIGLMLVKNLVGLHRAAPGLERAVLVALTGWGSPEDRLRTTEAGFDHHLVKPVEPAVLESLLAGLQA